jgi:hypothetical protein
MNPKTNAVGTPESRTVKGRSVILAVAAAAAMAMTGCSSITRGTPVAPVQINANMDRTDYQVLASTEGESTRASYLGGLFNVIDGDKYQVLGIKFFQDEYAHVPRGWLTGIGGVSLEDRAYYRALAATPDADAVSGKAMLTKSAGVPLIYTRKTVTYQGKALKYKPHD